MKNITTSLTLLVLTAFASSAAALDWPMWGGTPDRNMVSDAKNVSLDFDLEKGTNVAWMANLGSQTYGNPIVADGRVFVGTNNGGGYREDKHPAKDDKGVLLCFEEASGKFLWQLKSWRRAE
jgi:outer membrane protein assembly factor BamB